jgi:Pyruvate/2-oxoacid:ferredoxin oxidoreductase delta subunit
MKKAIIKPEVCKNCATCKIEDNCVNKAIIRENSEEKPWIDFYMCKGCMKCVNYCTNKAVEEIYHPCTGNARKGW